MRTYTDDLIHSNCWKIFVDDLLSINGKWSSPRDDAKFFYERW